MTTTLLLSALLAVNAVALALFVHDKRAATRSARRVPERTLLLLAALGAAPALVAATPLIRHKTRKEPFRTLLRTMLALQLAAAAALTVWP